MNVDLDNFILLSRWLKDNTFYSESILEDEKNLTMEAERKVLKLFWDASQRVPAYKNFLKKHKINPVSVKTIVDFVRVSPTTKENYVEKYSLEDRCWDGNLGDMHMISTSSGTTGKPHFWPRDLLTEIEGAYAHELILKRIFDVDNKNTLFINGFAMGNWIAGTFTLASVNLVAWKGYPITSMTPGYSAESIIEVLKNMSPRFGQVIISGHTPFLKELVELAIKRGVNWRKISVKLLGTGQAITENWRDYILNLLGSHRYYDTVINLYGSADAGLMGFETPLSIHLRRLLLRQPDLSKEAFKKERIPALYSYDSRLTYFEQANKELCISKNAGCPLIRYNIHDEGGVVPYAEMMSYFRHERDDTRKIVADKQWKLPFVYLFGREKFMVKIYGANVYSEHVQLALNHKQLQPLLTGRFLLETDYDKDQNPLMICRIELSEKAEKNQELVKLTERIFINEIKKINSEYRFLLEKLGDKVKPKIILHEHGHEKYFPKGKIKKTA